MNPRKQNVGRTSGFTLIELMVVLLIIAILLAIAIPTFLGVTSSANDRATQSNLTNALTETTHMTDAKAFVAWSWSRWAWAAFSAPVHSR